MSKDISIFKSQSEIIHSDGGRTSALGKKLAGTVKFYSRRIQTNNKGFFRKVVNGENIGEPIRDSFNAIVVGMLPGVSRIYYKEKYDPEGEPTLPNCWSNNNDVPEPQSADKQHANCANCPQNVKGSGDNGGRACRYQRRIAVLLAGDSSGDVYQFSVPAKSLFGKGAGNVHPYESYVKYLLANREAPDTVITQISYDLEAEGMELTFSPVRQLNANEFALVEAAQLRPETELYTRVTVSQTDGVVKLPAMEPQVKQPAVTRSEEPDGEEVAEVEPIKRVKRREEVVASGSSAENLASVIDDWSKGR